MKVLNKETQNCGLSWNYSSECEILFNVPKFGKFYSKERNQSFKYLGPALFNSLPLCLRKEITDTSGWKVSLDKFLEMIPDNPITAKITSGLCEALTSKSTNSLLKWIPHLGLSGRRLLNTPE